MHIQMALEPPLGKEVGRELHTRSETSSHHGWANTAIYSLDSLSGVDCSQAVPCVAVLVLCADWEEGAVALQAGLYEKEGRAEHGANDSRARAGKNVDWQVLQ